MPHFVVTFNALHSKGDTFAVEWFHECKHRAKGGLLTPHECYFISDAVAAYGMDTLINLYRHGIRPKNPALQPLALSAPEQPALPSQPRNMLAMG